MVNFMLCVCVVFLVSCLAELRGIWYLSSLTRDRIHARYNGSTVS